MTIKLQLHELSKSVRIPVKFKLSRLCAKIVGDIPADSDVAMQVERIVADGKQEQVLLLLLCCCCCCCDGVLLLSGISLHFRFGCFSQTRELDRMILMRIYLSIVSDSTYSHSLSHTHTLTINCTCCYDETKGTRDQDLFSC